MNHQQQIGDDSLTVVIMAQQASQILLSAKSLGALNSIISRNPNFAAVSIAEVVGPVLRVAVAAAARSGITASPSAISRVGMKLICRLVRRLQKQRCCTPQQIELAAYQIFSEEIQTRWPISSGPESRRILH